jgi:NAD(P)-dependent dehydrogenase (short-subunit alcohol dehydrogenase family)
VGLLDGKVAVVTGASTGIGQAIMATYCREGARVVAASRTASRLEEAADKVRADGGTVHTVAADLSDDEQVGRVIDAAVQEFGALDVLVNNAGVGYAYRAVRPGSMLPLDESSVDDWNHVMGINLGSVVYASRRAIPIMKDQGAGSIINVASVLGLRGHPDAHAYTTAKGAIVNLTRSLATTYARFGIRSNVICPGYIDTPMVAEYVPFLNSEEQRFVWNPMGRTGEPREIADGALYLGSSMGSYCNGAELVIDGGMIAKSG